jgi:hypothetical protein
MLFIQRLLDDFLRVLFMIYPRMLVGRWEDRPRIRVRRACLQAKTDWFLFGDTPATERPP